MNELSWLIYAADVADSAGGWLWFGGIAGGIVSIVGAGAYAISLDESFDAEEAKPIRSFAGRLWKWSLPLLVFSVVVSVAVPGRETVYAIAASEMGERVLTSETGGKAVEALNAWLDRQIGQPAPVSQ